jgi:hypothetical protein
MKKPVVFLVILFLSVVLGAQSGFEWVAQAGGENADRAHAIATDGNGNVYLAGFFQNSISFGTITLAGYGSLDIFVAKVSPVGNWLWAVRAGGTGLDIARGISTDAAGNCYVVGKFQGAAAFGSFVLQADGGSDVFATKLDPDGNFLWAARGGGQYDDYCLGIDTNSDGVSYLTGSYKYSASFGDITLPNTGGSNDIFVAKIDTNGSWVWVQTVAGGTNNRGSAVAWDTGGNCLVCGHFQDSAVFGADTLSVAGVNDWDIFVGKMDGAGNWLWARRAGSPTSNLYDEGMGIAADGSGNCYVTGIFRGTGDFGATILDSGDPTMTDIFIAKLDILGNWMWANSAGGTGTDSSYGIALGSWGDVYVTGDFVGAADFGSQAINSFGSNDIFIAGADPSGNWLWAQGAGGTSPDRSYGICIGIDGNLYITGQFYGTADFGDVIVSSAGSYDTYVAKFSVPAALPVPLPPQNLCIEMDQGGVLLQWDPVTQDTEGGAISTSFYDVYFCGSDPYGQYEWLDAVQGLYYFHSGAASLGQGFYQIKAVLDD